MSEIEHLRAVGRAATEGPWEVYPFVTYTGVSGPDAADIADCQAGADADFITTARNEWDGLLDEVESLRAKVARVEALLSAWEGLHSHLGIERGLWGPSSRDLRAALADESAQDALSRPGTTAVASGATGDMEGAQIGARDDGGK